MNTLLIIIAIGLIAVIGLLLVILVNQKKQQQSAPEDSAGLQMLNQNMQGVQQRLDNVTNGLSSRLDTVATGMNERLDKAAYVIQDVKKELGSMQEIGRNMQGLQEFLRSPKLRGNIGEKVLEEMLAQYFPQHLFQMQYRFKDGSIVDAMLQTDNGIIPIDSKFPLENYQRLAAAETEEDRALFSNEFAKDVKKHVNDISKKYILPQEGTVDFAIMYVPSESVYYEIVRMNLAVQTHAFEKHVMFVSPNSFYYFLQVILTALREKEVAQAAQEILQAVKAIQKDVLKFSDEINVVEKHVVNAAGAMTRAKTQFGKLADKIERVDDIQISDGMESEEL